MSWKNTKLNEEEPPKRFCAKCGEPLVVNRRSSSNSYNPLTGEPETMFVMVCPKYDVVKTWFVERSNGHSRWEIPANFEWDAPLYY